MELVTGRPADCAGRLEKEVRVYDFLDRLGVAYQRVDHEAAMTMEACAPYWLSTLEKASISMEAVSSSMTT